MNTPASMLDELRRMRDGSSSPSSSPSPIPPTGDDNPVRRKVFARADELGVPRTLADRLIAKESSWSHVDAGGKVKRGPVTRSGERAVGLMQVMPSTGASMGFKNLDDEDENITAGLTYIKRGLDTHGGDEGLAALYYFGGPGAAARAARTGKAPNIDDGNGNRRGTSAADYMTSVGGGGGGAARNSSPNTNPMLNELRQMRDDGGTSSLAAVSPAPKAASSEAAPPASQSLSSMLDELRQMRDGGGGNNAASSPVELPQTTPVTLPTPTLPSPSTSMFDELRQMRDATSQESPLPVVSDDASSPSLTTSASCHPACRGCAGCDTCVATRP
ncbi:MAG: transglycosylase SLT domain-containing protein [Pyrinomonadaceae bacterium MAG19_C2-C3]|nr:transglycosylase SLT domain-containing protein [Pyrinomonadaceae bacterium MAG19_C2-C3]